MFLQGDCVSSDVVCTKGALLMTSIPNIRSINCFPSLIWVSVSTLMIFIQKKVSKKDNKDLFIVTCDGGPIKNKQIHRWSLDSSESKSFHLFILSLCIYSLSDFCEPRTVLGLYKQWTKTFTELMVSRETEIITHIYNGLWGPLKKKTDFFGRT